VADLWYPLVLCGIQIILYATKNFGLTYFSIATEEHQAAIVLDNSRSGTQCSTTNSDRTGIVDLTAGRVLKIL
jgi:hypothetical protein